MTAARTSCRPWRTPWTGSTGRSSSGRTSRAGRASRGGGKTFPPGAGGGPPGGPFVIGSNIAGEPGFEGRVKIFRYWTRVLTSVENTELYSAGVPVLHEALPDSFKVGLRCAYDMNEPYGNREDAHGSSDLS